MDNAFAEIQRIGGLETEDDYSYDAHAEQVYIISPRNLFTVYFSVILSHQKLGCS